MGYENDFQNLGLLQGGAQGFIRGMQDAEDHNFRKLEMEAKVKARDDDKKRQSFMDALDARSKGFKVPDGGGSLYDTSADKLEYDPAYLQMQQDKLNADPFGLKGLQAQNAGLEGKNKGLEIQKKLKDASQEARGFKLPPDKVLQVQAGAQLPKMLTDIEGSLASNSKIMGPVQGRVGAANPYDTTAQTVDAQFRNAAQSFGRYMEGGVLRKEDEEKYRKMFPQLSDDPAVAKNKLSIVRKALVDKQNADVHALSAQGYDTSGFSQIESAELPDVLKGKKKGLVKPGMVGGQKGLVKQAAPSGKVKVSNGAEILMIDPKDLADAMKDGFKEVK